MSRFDILTLHPTMFASVFATSMLGRAVDRGHLRVGLRDIREHGLGRHRSVDDGPYGGGAGMVMRVDVVAEAIRAVRGPTSHVVLLSPEGKPFVQSDAESLCRRDHVILVCGHYEGIDARIHHVVDEVLSLGDFVLTGGEIAAMAVVDAVARLLPDVLGNEASAQDESFSDGLLEYPQYTRPETWEGHAVPSVLLSGHHQRISDWRRAEAASRTRKSRPDLWRAYLNAVDDGPADE